MKCQRKECNVKLNKKEIAKKYGQNSSLLNLDYCTYKCYTKDLVNKIK